jgi:hypothetical protein
MVEGMLGINGQWALQYRQMVEGMLGINGQWALQYRKNDGMYAWDQLIVGIGV